MATTGVSVEQFRSQLLSMAQAPDPYPFLTIVEEYLAVVPLDEQMRALAVGALIQKGLYRVAIELAAACPSQSVQANELRTATQRLSQLPSDQVDWSTCDARFAANLAALRESSPAGVPRPQEQLSSVWAQTAADLKLHRTNDGNHLVRCRRSDGRWIWVPAALDFANQTEVLADSERWKGTLPAPVLVEGVGMGWFISRLHAASTHTFLSYSPAIFIVERNLRALAVALRLHDWTALLHDERVFLFAGESAWQQWAALMRQNDYLPLPAQVTLLQHWLGSPASPGEQVLASVTAHRQELFEREQRRAGVIYSGRDLEFWSQRFAGEKGVRYILPERPEGCFAQNVPDPFFSPLRVLGITSRFTTFLQHSTRDVLAAFERAGMLTRLLIEQHDYDGIPRHAFMAAIADFRPDLILVIDHHRHEYPARILPNIPFVCWIQDQLQNLFSAEAGRQLQPMDFTIGFGRTECVLQHGYPAERFMPCKLAINPEKFMPRGVHPSRDRKGADSRSEREPLPYGRGSVGNCSTFRCDVAYVSHQSETPAALHARVRAQFKDELMRRLIDAFYEETRPLMASGRFNAGYDLYRLLSDVENNIGIACHGPQAREQMMNLFVRPIADRTLRHTMLRWAADWVDATDRKLHLYGRGWEQHPRLAAYARGPAEHGGQLGEIARQAVINLHGGINPALHQRVLETVAAGGFILARYCPFDFYKPAIDLLRTYIRERGIRSPTRIPLEDLPPEYVAARHRTASVTNRPVGQFLEITPELLLENEAAADQDRRYEYASLAFPQFERITFDSAEQFVERAEYFLAHAHERQNIVSGMGKAIREMFTYDALVSRLLSFLTDRLERMAAGDPAHLQTGRLVLDMSECHQPAGQVSTHIA